MTILIDIQMSHTHAVFTLQYPEIMEIRSHCPTRPKFIAQRLGGFSQVSIALQKLQFDTPDYRFQISQQLGRLGVDRVFRTRTYSILFDAIKDHPNQVLDLPMTDWKHDNEIRLGKFSNPYGQSGRQMWAIIGNDAGKSIILAYKLSIREVGFKYD